MNILIPCAGLGSRFKEQGFALPKPMIDTYGKPMIQWVVESLSKLPFAKFIFLVQKSHCTQFGFATLLKKLVPNCIVLPVDGLTEGAACTSLIAKPFINNNQLLIIANSDQYVTFDHEKLLEKTLHNDGCILTFENSHPKWSYVRTANGYVKEVAEKYPISNQATVGIYTWTRGNDYVDYAEQMIAQDIRVNNEFYICPVYNEAIRDGKKIATLDVDSMHGLGTPEDYNKFVDFMSKKENA